MNLQQEMFHRLQFVFKKLGFDISVMNKYQRKYA